MAEGGMLGQSEGHDLMERPVAEFTTDRAFHAALKLHVHATVHDGVLATLLSGHTLLVDQTVRLQVGRFTARKAAHLFAADSGPHGGCAEFHGFTSHKVREKLAQLHDQGVVELLGKGLRDAHTYRWKEPLRHWDVCSFMRLRARLPDDLSLALELYRAYVEMGSRPFHAKAFVDMYARVHGAEYNASRWGRRKWERISSSFAYAESIKARLDRLAATGLLLVQGETYCLGPEGRDAAAYADLFIHGAAYRASREMCDACPLDALCLAGSTQRALVALNHP